MSRLQRIIQRLEMISKPNLELTDISVLIMANDQVKQSDIRFNLGTTRYRVPFYAELVQVVEGGGKLITNSQSDALHKLIFEEHAP